MDTEVAGSKERMIPPATEIWNIWDYHTEKKDKRKLISIFTKLCDILSQDLKILSQYSHLKRELSCNEIFKRTKLSILT